VIKRTVNQEQAGSFRDPSGFLFYREGELYRQVNLIYKEDYDYLLQSGLYEALVKEKLLISHEDVDLNYAHVDNAYKVIKPQLVPFISYPYEWCFSQLKAAALTTLKIQKKALEFGMSLKDSSAYNIQFVNGKPTFIDTLSFERYREGEPWVAYKQFCQHFLAPLALMSYRDIRLNQLFRIYIDGIPLDLASPLLSLRTYAVIPLLIHIHLHAKTQRRFAGKTVDKRDKRMSRLSFLGLIDNLESSVKKMMWFPSGTEWGDYYNNTNYSSAAHKHKSQIIDKYLGVIKPNYIWDIGANFGLFSRLGSDRGIPVISFDIDPSAVEQNYLECVKKGETKITPLLLDLTNPSSAIGWENKERMSWLERGPTDTAFALALIHHLAISNNLPLNKIAHFFSTICKFLIIEFVPKSDSQVQKLLSTRPDIFPDYNQPCFENEFKKYFSIKGFQQINGSERTLYILQKNTL
jgi:ribosomal protein L11 methylase PrmA